MNDFVIREATRDDVPLIMAFLKELADYEHLTVQADADTLRRSVFDDRRAFVLIGECGGVAVGYAIYFFNFSSFLGRAGLYLEDIYIKPEYRGRGFGKAFLTQLEAIAKANSCGRMEWTCLNWNTNSMAFYESIGAKALNEWVLFRKCL